MSDEDIIKRALSIIGNRLQKGPMFSLPQDVKHFLCLAMQGLEHEVFSVMFLDSQHRMLAYEDMFRGTITRTSVYPREVLKRALALNSSAVVLAHNHPSGVCEPSRADEYLTQALKTALALIDVRVIDHIVVSGNLSVSMAERGLL